MKNLVKTTMLTVVSLMAVTFFIGCDKEMVNEPLQVQTQIAENSMEDKNLLTASKPIDQYSEEEIVKEAFPILQKFIDAQFAYAMGKDKEPQWNQYLKTQDSQLQSSIDKAVCFDRKIYQTKIISYSGSLQKSKSGYTTVFFKDGKWHINKVVNWHNIVNGKDFSDHTSFTTRGGWNYSFVVSQNQQGKWQIDSWRDDENITNNSIWYRSDPYSILDESEKCLRTPISTFRSSGYNAQLAVDYANAHWDNPNPAWCDYTNNGGDCTNFVSQCLLSGGWTQKYGSGYCSNDAWFHKGSGHCWNTSTVKNYSCSWTQAKDLYRYLNNVSNVNVTWLGNISIYARIGDIVQIKRKGSITHSMIVTKIENGRPFVTYRNGGGNDPQQDIPLSVFPQENLYYWTINGGNGILS